MEAEHLQPGHVGLQFRKLTLASHDCSEPAPMLHRSWAHLPEGREVCSPMWLSELTHFAKHCVPIPGLTWAHPQLRAHHSFQPKDLWIILLALLWKYILGTRTAPCHCATPPDQIRRPASNGMDPGSISTLLRPLCCGM